MLAHISTKQRLGQGTGDEFAKETTEAEDDIQPFSATEWNAGVSRALCLERNGKIVLVSYVERVIPSNKLTNKQTSK